MKPRKNSRLRYCIEIHQGISTDEQVDTRDRRVLYEIIATENYESAQILPEHVSAVLTLEVFFEQLRGNGIHLLRIIHRVASYGECLFIDIGCVNFYAASKRVVA